jgi:tetratricopeptide (TPR) repeat protein
MSVLQRSLPTGSPFLTLGICYGTLIRIFPEIRAGLTLNLSISQFDSQPSLLSRSMVIALTKINASHFPDSYYTFFVLAELYKTSRQTDLAIESYTRAIELNPRAERFLGTKIAELRADAQ